MLNIFQRIASRLFGFQYVVVKYSNGYRFVERARWAAGAYYALHKIEPEYIHVDIRELPCYPLTETVKNYMENTKRKGE